MGEYQSRIIGINETVKENSRDKDAKSKDAKVNKLEGNKYIDDDMMPIY